jgi:hypothetical protein
MHWWLEPGADGRCVQCAQVLVEAGHAVEDVDRAVRRALRSTLPDALVASGSRDPAPGRGNGISLHVKYDADRPTDEVPAALVRLSDAVPGAAYCEPSM